MPSITIKQIGGSSAGEARYATGKVFLRESKIYPPLRPGEVIDVSDAEAQHWLGTDLKSKLEITYDESNREPPPPFGEVVGITISEDNRPALIRSAIRRVDRKDRDLWTDAGKPLVSAIEHLLGFDISALERDTEWDALKDNLEAAWAELDSEKSE